MSDAPDDFDLLAGEYVLGTLDADERAGAAARIAADPSFAAAVAAWESRLAPLAVLVGPVAPPAALWDRLATSAGIAAAPAEAPAASPRPNAIVRAWRSLALWRFATAAGFAAAAVLALTVARPPPPAPPPAPVAAVPRSIAALVPQGSAAAAFAAEVAPDGSLRIVALEPVTVASGRDLELWALPPGATAPVSLGVLPAGGRVGPTTTTPSGRTQLLVSLEPRGGSPTGQPTGPVLYAGTLRAD